MGVPFKHLTALPFLFPIPQFDQHVVAACEDIGMGRMDADATNVISVCFEGERLLQSVIVKYTNEHVV
jgi:hypothetical protein